jgi:hypothetical protein
MANPLKPPKKARGKRKKVTTKAMPGGEYTPGAKKKKKGRMTSKRGR